MENSIAVDGIYHGKFEGTATFGKSLMRWNAAGIKSSAASVFVDKLKKVEISGIAGRFALRLFTKVVQNSDETVMKIFYGFRPRNIDELKARVFKDWGVTVVTADSALSGWNVGKLKIRSHSLEFQEDTKRMLDVPFKDIEQIYSMKNDIVLELQDDDLGADHESLSELRFQITPPGRMDEFIDDSNVKEGSDIATELTKKTASGLAKELKEKAKLFYTTQGTVVKFKETLFTTPRGRFELCLSRQKMFLLGKTFSFRVAYSDIIKMFLLPDDDEGHILIIGLKKPVNHGKTFYNFLTMNFKREEQVEVTLDISRDDLVAKYDSKISQEMEGSKYKVVTRVLKALSAKRVFMPGTFESMSGDKHIRCALRASQGLLFPLEASFIYCLKPVVYVQHSEIINVEFLRVVNSLASTKMFDLALTLRPGRHGGAHSRRETKLLFTGIMKTEFKKLFRFIATKNLRIVDKEEHEARIKSLEEGNRGAFKTSLGKRTYGDLSSESSSDEEFDTSKVMKIESAAENEDSDR